MHRTSLETRTSPVWVFRAAFLGLVITAIKIGSIVWNGWDATLELLTIDQSTLILAGLIHMLFAMRLLENRYRISFDEETIYYRQSYDVFNREVGVNTKNRIIVETLGSSGSALHPRGFKIVDQVSGEIAILDRFHLIDFELANLLKRLQSHGAARLDVGSAEFMNGDHAGPKRYRKTI